MLIIFLSHTLSLCLSLCPPHPLISVTTPLCALSLTSLFRSLTSPLLSLFPWTALFPVKNSCVHPLTVSVDVFSRPTYGCNSNLELPSSGTKKSLWSVPSKKLVPKYSKRHLSTGVSSTILSHGFHRDE